jgi:hydroxymethylbilane synthase
MGFKETIKIGTRKSRLAMAQAQQVSTALSNAWPEWNIELVPMTTTGDRFADAAVSSVEGKGIFLKELEDALLNREIDCAVHSMKDVPTEQPAKLAIAAMLQREDPRDGLVASCSLDDLPAGSTIGTGSDRRISQLSSCRPDLKCAPVRGNIDTRIRKWQEGQYDALVLAMAGMNRIGLAHLVSQILSFDIMLPAAGQGAIGIEVRRDDQKLIECISSLDHPETSVAVSAERAFLEALGGGCRRPIGVYGAVEKNELQLSGRMLRIKDGAMLSGKLSGHIEDSMSIANRLAKQLLSDT